MRFSDFKTTSSIALWLLITAAHGLPQGPVSTPDCPDGRGLFTATAGGTAVCTPCSSINRADGEAGSGACGACSVTNSALDASSGACLCGATDKGRVGTGTACVPCGVNGFGNGDRITCSPCIVGASLRADLVAGSPVLQCHCNTDKGYHVPIGAATTAKKCVMCSSLGRRNWSAKSAAVYGEECSTTCLPAFRAYSAATGTCSALSPTLENGGFEIGGDPSNPNNAASWSYPPIIVAAGRHIINQLPVQRGSHALRFGTNAPWETCQRFGPVSAGPHTLTFWLTTTEISPARPGGFKVFLKTDTTTVLASPELKDGAVSFEWALHTFPVNVPSTSPLTLCFVGWNPPNYYLLDDVSFV